MNNSTLMDVDSEPSDEMLHLIMKEVATEAKLKMEISENALNEKIIKETEEAQRKYFSEK